jgi:hypothetical protein
MRQEDDDLKEEKLWKEAGVAYFDLLSRYSLVET